MSTEPVEELNPMRMQFNFDNSYARAFEGFYVRSRAILAPDPKLLQLNHALAEELGLDPNALDSEAGAAIFSGNQIPEGAEPLAQAYAGHQFGSHVPQLGDGRALLLGEVIDTQQCRRDIQLKGSGPTPFSRGGDGMAPLGPVLREYLIGEGMHALGIPTTRALAAVATGELVYRETPLPGGVLTRVAASHLRVGTFQFFAARGGVEKTKELADYAIARHYPGFAEAENPYLEFFKAVTEAQAALVAQWMHVGFIHGVMNTDNMTISGETLDYGPCAFMDTYNPGTFFSSIDRRGRYAYANQPVILHWNLTRFAETLVPLVDPVKDKSVEKLTEVLNQVESRYEAHWLAGMRTKLGLATEETDDLDLVNDLLWVMKDGKADFTLVFRRLSQELCGDFNAVRELFEQSGAFDVWARRWRKRLEQEGAVGETCAQAMDRVNPIYIPRNHKVEEALIAAVNHSDLGPFTQLLAVLQHPFDETPGNEAYATPLPNPAYVTFCGT